MGLLALYRHQEILVNSSQKGKKKLARVISETQLSDFGPLVLFYVIIDLIYSEDADVMLWS